MKENNQESPIVIEDNVECIRQLTNLGVLHMLEVDQSSDDNTRFYHFTEPNYWCQASHHIGHSSDEDNGYMIIKIPKSKMTKEEAGAFFLDMMIANREDPARPGHVSFKHIPPLKSN